MEAGIVVETSYREAFTPLIELIAPNAQ
jgi:hypothetical protein